MHKFGLCRLQDPSKSNTHTHCTHIMDTEQTPITSECTINNDPWTQSKQNTQNYRFRYYLLYTHFYCRLNLNVPQSTRSNLFQSVWRAKIVVKWELNGIVIIEWHFACRSHTVWLFCWDCLCGRTAHRQSTGRHDGAPFQGWHTRAPTFDSCELWRMVETKAPGSRLTGWVDKRTIVFFFDDNMKKLFAFNVRSLEMINR